MRALRHVPFGIRLGPSYTRSRHEIRAVERLTGDELDVYTLDRLRTQVERVYHTNDFYHRHWQDHGFRPPQLQTLADLGRIPIVTKRDLREAPFSSRSSKSRGTIPLNTGGSTGTPLGFTVDAGAFAREWAHMHAIWSRVGFRPKDGRLTVRGHALGGRGYRYNAAHHEYQVDLQVPIRTYAASLRSALEGDQIRFIHGYPSAIAAFLREAANEAPNLMGYLAKATTAVLLGSEYPHPRYRDFIAATLEANTLSWYGHSEMAVLAFERDPDQPFQYHSMPTYGLAEGIKGDDQATRLVATTFHNTATPFIRYDTGDLIESIHERNGVIRVFAMAAGRVGEFVEDRAGRPIPLTGLIFGRHHRAFKHAAHVQLHQPRAGHLNVYVTPVRGGDTNLIWADMFDFTGTDLVVRFFSLSQPVRTPSGKTPLKLSSPPEEGETPTM